MRDRDIVIKTSEHMNHDNLGEQRPLARNHSKVHPTTRSIPSKRNGVHTTHQADLTVVHEPMTATHQSIPGITRANETIYKSIEL